MEGWMKCWVDEQQSAAEALREMVSFFLAAEGVATTLIKCHTDMTGQVPRTIGRSCVVLCNVTSA